jgi:phosphate transport system substrate-binding protein
MRKNLFVLFVTLMIASIALSACGGGAAAASSNSSGDALAAGSIQINGAGATFPLPIYTEWTYAYQFVDPAVIVNYEGIGSGGGKKAIIDGTVDFAGSDSLVSDDEYTAGKDLQMYPTVAGAEVMIYNIPELDPSSDPVLIFDRQTLVDIYLGKVITWNDPEIVATNPGVASKLPNQPIVVAHRSDGSGTTEIFTRALTSFSADWKSAVGDPGYGTSIEWPVAKSNPTNDIGGKGNQGVAAAVQNTPYAIGYVELNYAVANNLAYAQFVNKAGKTVSATDRLTNVIVDGPGDGTWPIAGYTYLVLHQTSMTDCVKAQKLLEYIKWTETDPAAAKRATDLGYSTLPPSVRDQVLAKLGEVTCNGQPVMK